MKLSRCFDFNWYTSNEKNSKLVLYQDLILGITEEFDNNDYLPYNAKLEWEEMVSQMEKC